MGLFPTIQMELISRQSCHESICVVSSGKYTHLCIYGVAILFRLLKFTINLFSITTMLLIHLESVSLLHPYLLLTRAPEDEYILYYGKILRVYSTYSNVYIVIP